MKLLFVSFFFLFPVFSFSQDWKIEVYGNVKKNNKNLDASIVTVFKNGSQVDQLTTGGNGKFTFELQSNADYLLTFTKAGHIMKKISISTRGVPVERAKFGFKPYPMDVSIFETIPGVNLDALLSQPIAKLKYDPTVGVEDFEFDALYTVSIQSQLDRIRAAEEEARKKAEQLEKSYQAAIQKGDKSFSGKNYTDAKTYYNEALTYKPAEIYPKTKLAEIDKLLASDANKAVADAKAKADADAKAKADAEAKKKAEEEARKKAEADAKAKADTEARAKMDAEAKKKAEADAKLKAEADAKAKAEADARAKMDAEAKKKAEADAKLKAEIEAKAKADTEARKKADAEAKLKAEADAKKKAEDARLAKELDQKYTETIKKADAALVLKDYANAKTSYKEASGYKPDIQYPKVKIAEIDKILAAQQAEKDRLANDKAQTEKYNSAISNGNRLFAEKKYTEARVSFSEASQLRPNEKYPVDKIAQIDRFLKDQEFLKQKDKQYQDLIAKADGLFEANDFKNAKLGYTEASTVKPDEKYPKDRIRACDTKLRANATIVMNNPTNNTIDKQKDEEERRKAFVNELVKKYPQGVTEEITTDAQGKTIKRIVVKGNDAWVYIKKIYSYGTYWFKDGSPISEDTFEKETKKS